MSAFCVFWPPDTTRVFRADVADLINIELVARMSVHPHIRMSKHPHTRRIRTHTRISVCPILAYNDVKHLEYNVNMYGKQFQVTAAAD